MTLSPENGTTLRAVERAFATAGVHGIVAPGSRRVHVALPDFARAERAFSEWQLQVDERVVRAVAEIKEREQRVARAKAVIDHYSSTDPDVLLPDFPSRGVLDPHQIQAVAIASHKDVGGLCLFDEQGLGKTAMALFAFHRLRSEGLVTRMLVVTPKNVISEWVRDAGNFFTDTYRLRAVVGTSAQKRACLNERADIYVTNFETAVTLRLRLEDWLEAEQGRALLVVDEGYFVKNRMARRTKAIRVLRSKVERCLILCGTPAPNRAQDLVEQFNIADKGLTFQSLRVPKDDEGARAAIQRVIAERGPYLRRLKDDVFPHLPGKTFHRVLVSLGPAQQRIYESLLGELIHDLEIVDDLTFKKNVASFMARRMGLLQVCSNPAAVVDGYEETPAKVAALDTLLEELIANRNEKVVLWSFFTHSLEVLLHRYERFHPVRLDGKVTSLAERGEAIRRFQEDGQTMLFVANPAAAGAGITLHRARYAVYESMSNQGAHYLQSLDRVHRRGQSRPVEDFVLLCDKTIEVREYERLIQKERQAQRLLGDQVRQPVTRQAMLRDAFDAARLIGLSA